MAELHVFGSGLVRVGAVGASLTQSANGVGSIQSMSANCKYDKTELHNTPVVSLFAVDVGFHSGELSMKLEFNDINRNIMNYVMGATKTTAGSTDTYTIGQTSQPSKFRLEVDTITTDATPKNVKLVFFNVYCPELPIDFAIKDYAKIALEIFALPDPSTGNMGTIAMDQ